MIYCTKCGKQNLDYAKFCTGCGYGLSGKVQSTSPPLKEPEKGAEPKKNKHTVLLLSVALLVITVIAAYFIFFNKKKEGQIVDKDNGSGKELVVQPSTDIPRNNTKKSDSKPVPLNPGSQSDNASISPTEVDNVSRRIDEFYSHENDENVTKLLSYYRFPLDQYFQLYNVSYDQLHKMVTEACNGKLYYHSINIKWNYSSVQKIGSIGYKALLFAAYTSASQSQDDRKTKDIHLTIMMNNNYEITAIYPN